MSDTLPSLQQWERGPKIVAVGGGGVFRARRDFRARFDVRPSGIRHEIPCFSDQRDL